MSWKRPRSQARIALGVCPCGHADAAPGGKRCIECRDKENARKRSIYLADREQGTPRFDASKYAQLAAQKRRIRAERVANKECLQCGEPVARFQRCPKCRIACSKAKAKYRQKKRMARILSSPRPAPIPVYRDLVERRDAVDEVFHLSTKQRSRLNQDLLDQLDRCASDVERRLLLGKGRKVA